MRRFEAAYVKCVKSFFGFERRYSVTQIFCDLGPPTFNTVIHNTRVRFESSVDTHDNKLVMHVFHIWWMFFFSFSCVVCCYVLMPVSLSVFFLYSLFLLVFMNHVAWNKPDLIWFDFDLITAVHVEHLIKPTVAGLTAEFNTEDWTRPGSAVRTSDVALDNCHPVGSQSAGLVRTDCRSVAHRFTGVQMSHQVVIVHHFLYNSQLRRVCTELS